MNSEEKCKALVKYKSGNITTLIIETPPSIQKIIKINDSKICIGHQRCTAYDLRRLLYDPVSMYCRGKYASDSCTNKESLKCSNCIYIKTKYKNKKNKDIDVSHYLTDLNKCAISKNKYKKIVENIDYWIQPDVPKYFKKI